ncbi:hypothetical protein CGLO_17591 [Colletotrichum gloeosporioides Cg-14]|uniref:Uncharacterized protein n=1 Tax=Colletotrichum gloeosporioides (strain Cg-14) TaxID=1237896 RepID=T0JKM3_COLGC|nr:hypothetical protein CGLO_17591 [Colletotrichum gloeosporioides Cg-14]
MNMLRQGTAWLRKALGIENETKDEEEGPGKLLQQGVNLGAVASTAAAALLHVGLRCVVCLWLQRLQRF